jgi:hypothetical protein
MVEVRIWGFVAVAHRGSWGGGVAANGGVAGEQPRSWVTGGQEGWMAVEARGEPEEEGKVEVTGQAREEDGGGGL